KNMSDRDNINRLVIHCPFQAQVNCFITILPAKPQYTPDCLKPVFFFHLQQHTEILMGICSNLLHFCFVLYLPLRLRVDFVVWLVPLLEIPRAEPFLSCRVPVCSRSYPSSPEAVFSSQQCL